MKTKIYAAVFALIVLAPAIAFASKIIGNG
ncbi:hypothetical protein EV561_13040 [Rhizobium sp. BK376]|jgi:hypothetical protein|nr:hypothetical protein EV561_13040 [Rhizobium sp. BK376]